MPCNYAWNKQGIWLVALHHIAAGIMDSVEFICSPLFFSNPSSQPLLTLSVFHFFLRAPFYPLVFRTIIVSVLLFCAPLYLIPPLSLSRRKRGSYKPRKECAIKKELLAERCTGCNARRNYMQSTQCEFIHRGPIREHKYSLQHTVVESF